MAAVLCTSAIAGKGDPVAGRDKADAERCLECHGAAGVGQGYSNGEQGKFLRYLAQQLHDWRSGARRNSPGGTMNQAAAPLSDAEIEALAQYVSEM